MKLNCTMHPSGMTQERWDWPFKTAEERRLVVKYFEKIKRQETKDQKKQIHQLEEALL